MARVKTTRAANKSDIVRDYLKGNADATVQEIVQDLRAHDISKSLAQKIKYKGGGGASRGSQPRRAAPRADAAPQSANAERKADSIRRVAGGMGKRVRPRDVIAALRLEGIAVTFAQVGQVLKSMGLRRRRSGGKQAGERSASTRTRAADANATASATISLDALIAAKKLADQLGGVQVAKQAVDALAKLS